MSKIRFVKVDLKIDKLISARDAEKLRGYIGREFSEDANFHNHTAAGYIYRYPLVQYKVVDHQSIIVGLLTGVDSVWRVFNEVVGLDLSQRKYQIFEKSISATEAEFGISERQSLYKFKTPWYSLNQKNYLKFSEIDTSAGKNDFLKKILIGNILSMSKSVGIFVNERINVSNLSVYPRSFQLDDVQMLGFLGTFSVNFHIPDYLGIGKSVSRGFGTVVRVDNDSS